MALLRGPELCIASITSCFENNIPGLVDRARIDWGMTEYELPYPTVYDAVEPVATGKDQYPFIGTFVNKDSEHQKRYQTDEFSDIIDIRYTMVSFVSVITPRLSSGKFERNTYASCIRLRNDMLTLVKLALLFSLDLDTDGIASVEPDSLSADYPGAASLDQGGYVANGVLHYRLRYSEELTLPPWSEDGDLTFDVDVDKLDFTTCVEELPIYEPEPND